MRADNRGEGGILALMSLIGLSRGQGRGLLVAAGLFGAALIYGDGIITPAISVLSAVEGVNVVTDQLKPYVMPCAAVILLALFASQTFGTARIGRVFGPIMLLWFLVIAVIGAFNVAQHPEVIAAIDPLDAIRFLAGHGWASFIVLGAVFLAVTGGEALYADMGHIGRAPIRMAWFAIVLPALLLSYAGQTAFLLGGGGGDGSPFFRAVPGWAVVPMVVLATLATIIASQAIITGSFSLTRQAIQLGWFPGLNIRQTSDREYGQIYVPVVNWIMMVFTLLLTIGFGSSDRLAGAYGTAVSTTMLLTTLLLWHAMRERWQWPWLWATLVCGVFLVVDAAFFSANLLKIAEGGWIPLVAGAAIYTVMTSWRAGVEVVHKRRTAGIEPPATFLRRLDDGQIPRVPGTAVFLTRASRPVPSLMVLHVEQFGALPVAVVSLTVVFDEIPRVAPEDRIEIERVFERFYHLTVHYGFVEVPNLKAALAEASKQGCDLDLAQATFFGPRDDVVHGRGPHELARWRQMLFSFLYRNAVHMVDLFDLDGERFIEIGRRIET